MREEFCQEFLQPRYGVDAPGAMVPPFRIVDTDIRFIGPVPIAVGLVCRTLFTAMIAYALLGKFRVRDRLLDAASWRGDE